MSDIFSALSALGFFLSVLAAIFAARTATVVRELQDQITRLPVSRLQSIETSLADTQDALTEVVNRVKMMKVRNAANHTRSSSGEPDPYTDPDRWRQQMNRQLALKNLGGRTQ